MRTHLVTLGEVEHKFAQRGGMKPDGLWWAIDDQWFDFLNHMESERGKDIVTCYEVLLDPDLDILLLDTKEKIDAFTERFTFTFPGDTTEVASILGGMWIDWPKVARYYQGIELDPYPHPWMFDMELTARWFISWDCASGCVWAPDGYELIERPELLEEWQRD